MNSLRLSCPAAVFCALVFPALGQPAAALKTADELPEIKELADPFVFADGSRVASPQDWARRREELKKLFADYQYGSLPPKPKKMTIFRGDAVSNEKLGVTTQDFILHMVQASGHLDLHLRLSLPLAATGKLPVVIQAGNGGGPPPPPRPNLPCVLKRGLKHRATQGASSPSGREIQ